MVRNEECNMVRARENALRCTCKYAICLGTTHWTIAEFFAAIFLTALTREKMRNGEWGFWCEFCESEIDCVNPFYFFAFPFPV